MSDTFDFNIEHYTPQHLFDTFGIEISDSTDINTLKNKIDEQITAYYEEFGKSGIKGEEFLEAAREKLKDFVNKINANSEIESALEADGKVIQEEVKKDIQEISLAGFTRGVINPNLQNTTTELISIDSRFKDTVSRNSQACKNLEYNPSEETTTNFSCVLTNDLNNVISFNLNSIEIPLSWYTIDSTYGTNAFKIGGDVYTIPEGNYTPQTLITAIQTSLLTKGQIQISYNETNGRATFTGLPGAKKAGDVIFFDDTGTTSELGNAKKNSNLGWILGFNQIKYTYKTQALNDTRTNASRGDTNHNGTLISERVVDTYGPRYLFLSLEDYNNNQVSTGVIGIGQVDNRLDLPEYYNCSLAQGNNGQVISSAPRRLTNNQIYAINEIRANQQVTKDWIRSPSSTDIFAKIPIVKPQSYYTGELYIDATTTLQVNERVYFGPVSIKRLKVRLLDDAGRILNLNGMDWSFTLQVTSMYQY